MTFTSSRASFHTSSTPESQPLLTAEAMDALLQHLMAAGWARLRPEYDDPLAMLMNQGTCHWTAGWVPGSTTLYVLIWETDSFQDRACWRMYENGTLIFEELDGQSKVRSAHFSALLESENLPFLSFRQWLDPLIDYNYPLDRRCAAVQAVMNVLFARPELLNVLKEPLFKLLELDLASEEWPVLEILKIHRLASKNPVAWLFQQLVQHGFIRTLRDNTRLDQALSLLQQDYFHFGYKVAPAARTLYEQAYYEFRRLITDGTWRTSLRLKVPQAY